MTRTYRDTTFRTLLMAMAVVIMAMIPATTAGVIFTVDPGGARGARVEAVDGLLGPIGRRVKAVVNYDRFQLDEPAVDAYADAVRYVQDTYYVEDGARRYSGNAFLRLKLSRELDKRDVDGAVEAS